MQKMVNLLQIKSSAKARYDVHGATGFVDPDAKTLLKSQFNEEEIDKVLKGKRRSIVTSEAVSEDFLSVQNHRHVKIDFECEAARYADKQLLGGTLNYEDSYVMPWSQIHTAPWNFKSSAEEPYRTDHPGEPHKKKDYINQMQEDHTYYIQNLLLGQRTEEVPIYDVLVNARSHIVSEDKEDKIRAAFGYPFFALGVEHMFYSGIYSKIINNRRSHIAWEREILKGGMHRINTMATTGLLYACFDYAKFDKTVPIALIQHIFDLLYQKIDLEHYCDANGNLLEEEVVGDLTACWKYLVSYFTNKGPTRLPDNTRWLRLISGVPSGSQFTQLIDSLVNEWIAHYIVYLILGPNRLHNACYLGDDSVLILNTDMAAEDFKEAFTRLALHCFNMEINTKPGKSVVTRDKNEIVFLGYSNHNGIARHDKEELLARFLMPEYYQPSWERLLGRSIGFAWSGASTDRRFVEVARVALLNIEREPDYGKRPGEYPSVKVGDPDSISYMQIMERYLSSARSSELVPYSVTSS
jgi:hypothetical protein